MDVSQSDADTINLILEGKASAAGHFLEICPQNPMIYGADGPQRIYLDLLLTARGRAQAVDVSAMPKADHPFISNYYLDWNAQGAIDKKGQLYRKPRGLGGLDPQDKQREQERRNFTDRVNQSRMGVGQASVESLKSDPALATKLIKGIQKDNPKLTPTVQQIASGQFDDQLMNFGVRRACKFLIYDAIQNKRKIAYVLDDLDLTEVVLKTARKLGETGDRHKVPVCTSEIREIFRRWDYLKDHIVFYRWFRKAPAPWDSTFFDRQAYEHWGAYAKLRAEKLAAKLGPKDVRRAQLAKVGKLCDAGDFMHAIDEYHAAKPSTLEPLPSAAWGT